MSPLLFLCLSFFTVLVEANAQSHRLSRQYTYNVQLDNEGRYTMFYSYDTNLSILRIAVLVNTTGWIGLGISPNGQMPGSDVVIGWVDSSGEAFLQDRYAFGRFIPRYDSSQDWILRRASENGGLTILQFERKLDTCDQNDIAINFGDTTHLIYSYHTEDPVDNEQFSQHQFQGSRTINLFGRPKHIPPLPPDVQFFDIVNINMLIPAKDTVYLCTVIEVPQVIQNTTHYILEFAAQITPESGQHVHHMLLYLCDGMNLTGHPAVGVSQECDGISRSIQPCRYSTIVAGWAIGGNDFTFPEAVALPIGGEDKIHTHFLLEIHYDNPDELSDIVDSSGFRVYYTDHPREENAGLLFIGQNIVGHMIIPPGVERYTVNAFCSSRCTNAYIPEEGITVFANLLHAHTVSVEMVLRHIRDGVELDPIDVNRNYDFNFQQTNFIPRVQILPGDEMILECVYNSKMRNITTFGGEGIKDEMCVSLLYYYPVLNISGCLSYVNPPAYNEWLNAYVPPYQHYAIVAAATDRISEARLVFDSLNWTQNSYRMFERVGQAGDQVHICYSPTDKNFGFTEINQPVTVERPLEESDDCLGKVDSSGSAILHGSVIIMMLCSWTIAAAAAII